MQTINTGRQTTRKTPQPRRGSAKRKEKNTGRPRPDKWYQDKQKSAQQINRLPRRGRENKEDDKREKTEKNQPREPPFLLSKPSVTMLLAQTPRSCFFPISLSLPHHKMVALCLAAKGWWWWCGDAKYPFLPRDPKAVPILLDAVKMIRRDNSSYVVCVCV